MPIIGPVPTRIDEDRVPPDPCSLFDLPYLPAMPHEPHFGDFLSLQYAKPFVRVDGTSRSLHFTQGELQSRMQLQSPWRLAVDYTRTMMGFLLFNPAPARIGMIGLGGGSIAKFCHRFLPASHMTVLEINPYVLALRHEFQVPDDDARLRVIGGDGAVYLHTEAPQYEVLLVDGFDQDGQPAALCTQGFYEDCLAALPDAGLLVVNLHYDHPDYPVLVERIRRSFNGHAVEVLTQENTNSIVFARKNRAISPRDLNLRTTLAGLEPAARSELRAELVRMLWALKSTEREDET